MIESSLPPLRILDYKAIVFDLFHTLTSLVHTKTPGHSTAEILGIDAESWNDALFHRSGPRLRGELTEPLDMLKSVVTELNLILPDEVLRDAAAHRYGRFRHSLLNPLPHIIDTLGRLTSTGLSIALVSNADKGEIAIWPDTPMAPLFDTVVFSCDVGMMKPEDGIFLEALENLGLKAADCLYVGDGGNHELQAAKKLGFTTVFTSEFLEDLWPARVQERRDWADYRIARIDQLCWNL